MADVFKVLRGIMGNLFKIGGPSGPQLKNSSGVVEVRNTGDTDYALARSANVPDGSSDIKDVINLLMLRGRVADIEFDFDGGSEPAAGTNTNKFGFCHTTGGSWTAGDIAYDDGSTLFKIPADVAKHLTSRTAVTGTISLIQNGFYNRQGATWVLKGDGALSQQGHTMTISVSYDYTDSTVSSTTEIPDGAVVIEAVNKVTTPFSGGTSPTVQVDVDGTADENVMATADSDMEAANEYSVPQKTDIGSSTTGPVLVTVTPDGSTAGAGEVFVHYTTPLV